MPRGTHDKEWFVPQDGKLVEFEYKNWRDRIHTYVVQPEAVAIAGQDPGGFSTDPAAVQFILHGDVITRDGEARTGDAAEFPRRSFMIRDIIGAVRVLERS